jgi:hypothetical protein
MTIIIDGTTGVPVSPVTGTLAVLNGGTGVTTKTGTGAVVLGTSPSISGAVMSTMGSSVITSGTAVASTSGTSIDFTGIPSWVKRITVMFSGVSTNGTSALLVQIGSSGTPVNTGYVGSVAGINGATTASNTLSAGFNLNRVSVAASNYQGNIVITNLTGNTWTASWTNSDQTTVTTVGAGRIDLAGTLNIVRFTSATPDTFDAGSINILYE